MTDIDVLIKENKGLLYTQLRRYHLLDDPEAESVGYEALYNAILNYDSSKNTALSTLITVYVYNALGSYTRTLLKQRQLDVVSYNNIAFSDDHGSHEFVELLQSDEDVEGDYIRAELGKTAVRILCEKCESLKNERHKQIIRFWKDSDFEATTTEIAKGVGTSQSYVSQVLSNFKFSLKKDLEDMYYG